VIFLGSGRLLHQCRHSMYIPLINKKVKRPWLWFLGLVLAGGIAATTGTLLLKRQQTPTTDVSALTVPVETAAITVRISASGDVAPFRSVNLSPKNSGIVDELLVEQGDKVEQGQVIARMDSRDLEAQLRQNQGAVAEAEAQLVDIGQATDREQIAQSEANLAAIEAQIADAQSRLNLARLNRDRNQNLVDQGAIAQSELDRTNSDVRSAEANLEQVQFRVEEARQRLIDLNQPPDPEDIAQAEARLESARGRLQATATQIEDTLIRAPFAGIITQKFATEGAFVTPTTSASDASSATSSAIVALAEGLEVVAEVPEADIAQIKPNQDVEITADTFGEQVFKGKVRFIAPEAIEKRSVTIFQVRIRLLTGQNQLLSNMNVNISFLGNQLNDALVIPTVAVVTQSGENGVLVPDEKNRIRFRPVTLGAQVGDQIEITQGLKEGDRVFINLPPGQTLENLRFNRDEN
jgi:HlyD family secretion protein